MTPAEAEGVTITQQASRQSKNASIAQMTTVDTIPAMSCGSVDESMDSWRRHVPHDAVGHVGRVPAVEEAHGQLPQVVGEAQAGAFGLGVRGHVGFLVVVSRSDEDHHHPRKPHGEDRPERGGVERLARKGSPREPRTPATVQTKGIMSARSLKVQAMAERLRPT